MIVTAVVGLPLHFMRTPTARAQPPLPLRTKATAAKDLTASKDLSASSAFLRRIPANLGTELLYLYIEVEDHYLRVHTPLGSDLLLFRLADAVAGLEPALGRQVHRSYWVARHAVASIERDGHRARLVLTTGAKIPVSRTYLPYCAKQVGFRRASPSPLKTGVPRRERLPQVAPGSLRTLQKKACGLRGFSGMSWTTSRCSTTLPPSSRKISTIARPWFRALSRHANGQPRSRRPRSPA
jgi:hypothetical protein